MAPDSSQALFKDSVTFNPQFNLVVCTNHPLEVQSQDDGTLTYALRSLFSKFDNQRAICSNEISSIRTYMN